MLYGTPPPGLDVRLSLQLPVQATADQLMGSHAGAAILMNADSGEILVMASHPTFNAGELDELGVQLAQDTHAPLVNRAVQGSYMTGTATTPFLKTLNEAGARSEARQAQLLKSLGLFSTPQIRMPVTPAIEPSKLEELRLSPLQMVIAASALSNHGRIPAPRIALAVSTPQQGWVILPALGKPEQAIDPATADQAANAFIASGQSIWEYVGQANQNGSTITWYLGGTLPDWQGTPLAVVVALEEENIYLARQIGRSLLTSSLGN
jgi:hypothetical protein